LAVAGVTPLVRRTAAERGAVASPTKEDPAMSDATRDRVDDVVKKVTDR
jgi:hypothetical protein